MDDAALVQRWVDTGALPPPAVLADTRRATALAWQLKALCYAAWSSDPPAARRAAAALATLYTAAGAGQPVIEALLHWTQAVASLTSGAMADAISSLDRAGALLEQTGHAAEAAQTRVPRIMALAMLGHHAEAVACAEDAQQRFTALGDRRSAAKTSLNLGSLQLRHDAYAEAARHYRQASALFARIEDREHSVMADIGIGDALAALGDVDEAMRIYARARMRAATHGLPVLQAIVDESMALLDLSCGRYGDALAGFENARRRYEALAMPQHLAIAEKQLADAYLELRLLPEALALYTPALEHMHGLQMPQDAAWTLVQRGRALALSGQADAADASFAAAAAAFDAQHSAVGSAAVQLARAELALARCGAGPAANLANPANPSNPANPANPADPAKPANPANPANAAIAAIAIDAASAASAAAVGFDAAQLPGASLRARIVAARAQQQLGLPVRGSFERLLAQAQAGQMLSEQVQCWVGLGDAAAAAQDGAAARQAFLQAITLFEQQRSALPGDDVRIAFLADHVRPYQAMLRLALQAHAQAQAQAQAQDHAHAQGHGQAHGQTHGQAHGPTPTQPHAADVLRWLDRVRARTLGERLLHGQAQPGGSAASAAVTSLRARLGLLTRRLQRLHDDGEPSSGLEQQRRRLELELLEVARRERLARGPSRLAAEAAADVAKDAKQDARQDARADGRDDATEDAEHDPVATLRQRLQPADALVEWGVCDGQLLACVVRPGGVQVQTRLATLADVQEALQAARFQIEALRHGAGRLSAHLPRLAARAAAHLQRLHGMLWAPLEPLLHGVQRLLLVPPAELGGLPFGALHDGSAALADRFQLALAPSAAWAGQALARTPTPPLHAVLVAESSRLLHTDAETLAVAACFTQPVQLRGADATVQALQQHAPQADVLHLACHAEFRHDNPMFSALHLADGPLTAERVESLALRAGTVVLSACDTALAGSSAGHGAGSCAGSSAGSSAGPSAGDEHIGLVRAFFVAGAARVVASLWPVDDAVTAQWMAAFYRALQSGSAPAAALQQAQASVRAAHPHPYFWAAFVLYGGW